MISIIIPMYNSEKYIEKCIESILNNLYKNFDKDNYINNLWNHNIMEY